MSEHRKEAIGVIYVEELNWRTPGAPLPDYYAPDTTPYWSWSSMASYQSGVGITLMEELERVAKAHGVTLDRRKFPEYPPYPVADIHYENHAPGFNEQSLLTMGHEIVRRFVAYGLSVIHNKGIKMSDYQIPCGKIVMESERAGAADSSSTRVLTPGKQCSEGNLCPACTEIKRLTIQVEYLTSLKLKGVLENMATVSHTANLIKGLKELLAGMPDQDAAKARLMAVARDLSTVEFPTQDPKYVIISGKICNAKTKEPVPDDEPIMIFRAKDWAAHSTIVNYSLNFAMGTPHFVAVRSQANRFMQFQTMYPERMKKADT